jgi:hypothetical protein
VEIGLWAAAVIQATAFGYTMRFTEATLAVGRELSETTSGTGFQDAVTPPWETTFALSVYAAIPAVVGLMWWQLGWVSAISGLLVILLGASVSKLFLPKASGGHYQRLILRSMIVRYANYVRAGDVVRADAMKQLLVRAGIDPDEMRS